MDKWRCLLDARYRDRYAEWTHVVICSNSSPELWYLTEPVELLQALRRRMAECCYLVQSREETLEEMQQTPRWTEQGLNLPLDYGAPVAAATD